MKYKIRQKLIFNGNSNELGWGKGDIATVKEIRIDKYGTYIYLSGNKDELDIECVQANFRVMSDEEGLKSALNIMAEYCNNQENCDDCPFVDEYGTCIIVGILDERENIIN